MANSFPRNAFHDIVNKSVKVKISGEPSRFKRYFSLSCTDQDDLIKEKCYLTIKLRLDMDAEDRLILKLTTHL